MTSWSTSGSRDPIPSGSFVDLEGCGLLSVQVPYHLWKGGRCYLMEWKVVPLLDRIAGRLL
jgi:hypothetical protein